MVNFIGVSAKFPRATATKAAKSVGMSSWRGLHDGDVACHRDKKSHAKWRWGQKKGLRRARRRVEKILVMESQDD